MPELAAELRRSDRGVGGFARTALWGSRWSTFQSVANKIATIAAMLFVARALDPVEYGMASVVNTVVGFVTIMPVLVMADVLISHQRHLASVARAAWGVALGAAVLLVLLIVGTAPWIAARYDQYSFRALALLLAFTSLRPMAEAFIIFPWTRLRLALRFRDLAIVNGLTRFSATVLMVAWAFVAPGAEAIVVPQILMTLARAVWFSAIAGGPAPRLSTRDPLMRRPELLRRIRNRMRRDFLLASLAQYVHTVTSGLAFIVASRFVSKVEIGEFAFALTLAPQFVGMFTVQVGLVLQPIFGRLRSDRSRQVVGFRRVVGVMGAVVVPVTLLQAALAEPCIQLLFSDKWRAAVPIFMALSVGQATMYLLPTTFALLKVQGRFGTTLLWQGVQALILLAISVPVARAYGALGVAIVDSALWTAGLIVASHLAVRVDGVSWRTTLRMVGTPWITGLPIAFAAWLAWRAMPEDEIVSPIVALAVIGPVCLLLALLSIRVMQPAVAAEMSPFMSRLLRVLPFVGPPLAAWFASAANGSTEERAPRP